MECYVPKQPTLQQQPLFPLGEFEFTSEQAKDLVQLIESKFYVTFQPDDVDDLHSVEDVFYLLCDMMRDNHVITQSMPVIARDELKSAVLENVKQIISETAGVTSLEIRDDSRFQDVVPYKRRYETYSRLMKDVGKSFVMIPMASFTSGFFVFGPLIIFIATTVAVVFLETSFLLTIIMAIPIIIFYLWFCGVIFHNSRYMPFETINEFVENVCENTVEAIYEETLTQKLAPIIIDFFAIPEEYLQNGVTITGKTTPVPTGCNDGHCGNCGCGHCD
jgi:acyl carrier protein